MTERFTAEQVLELLNGDFEVSGGDGSDFEEDGIILTCLELQVKVWTS